MRASISLMPRFNYAHEAADKFLMQLSVDRLPFNPDTALKDIGCKVYTYTEVAGHNHITLRDVAERFGSAEGCTFYRPGLDEYIVFVNDVDPSIPRLRWTLTHELSHIILRHLADNTADQLENSSALALSNIEREADACANELLGPSSVLYTMGCLTASAISETCFISHQAATIKENFFSKCHGYRCSRTEVLLLSQFDTYVQGHMIA